MDAADDTTVKKFMQLSPYMLKDQPARIKEHSFDCITQDQLFESEEERGQVYGLFGMAPDATCDITSPVVSK